MNEEQELLPLYDLLPPILQDAFALKLTVKIEQSKSDAKETKQ